MKQKTGIYRMKGPLSGMTAVLLSASLVFSLFSCTKPAPFPSVPITPLQQFVNTDTTLDFFHDLILQGNNVTVLQNRTVTVLAPTDSAFIAAGYTLAIIDSMPAYLAARLASYSFIDTTVLGGVSTVDSPCATLLGMPVYVTRDADSNFYFNGIRGVRDTVKPGLAVVYKMPVPFQQPYDSLDQALAADSNYSLLNQALIVTGLYDSLSNGLYDGGTYAGRFTLLAPDNTAFAVAGYPDTLTIDHADTAALANLLRYQFVNGVYFPNDLSGVTSLSSLQGETLSVSSQNGKIQFMGKSNTTPANLLSGSIPIGRQLIVHKTDQLLQP